MIDAMELSGIRICEQAMRLGASDRARIALVASGVVVLQPAGVECNLRFEKAIVIEAEAARTRGFRALAALDRAVVLPAASFAAIRMRLERELLARDEARLAALEGLALEVIAECARTYARQLDPLPPFVTDAAALIARSFTEPLTVAALAERLAVQPSTLAGRFRRHYGVTVGEYIRNCRIDFARRALASADFTVADVARQAGFYDQSHFVRVFKRATGETPISFRRAAAGDHSDSRP